MSNAAPALDLAQRFRQIAYALCEVVADHIRRDRNSGPMLELITKCLFGKMRRFDALFARFRAGAVFPPFRPRRRGRMAGGSTATEAAPPDKASEATAEPGAMRSLRPRSGPRLPRKKAWLTIMMPWSVALYAIRLRAFVDDPEVAAFLAACPQAAATLRDLWWSLCADPLPEPLRPPVDLSYASPAEAYGQDHTIDDRGAVPDAPPPPRRLPRLRVRTAWPPRARSFLTA